MITAVRIAHSMGVNPGGQVLMSRDDIEAADVLTPKQKNANRVSIPLAVCTIVRYIVFTRCGMGNGGNRPHP